MIHQITYGKVTWINIVNATPADVDRLSKMYRDIHPLNLEDLLSLSERPKLDIAETYLFVVMHFPVLDPKQRLTRSHEVDMIVGNGYVVTAHDGLLPPLNHLFKQVEESQFHREKLCGKGANHLFYVLVDQLVDYILPILSQIDVSLREVEEGIFSDDARMIIQKITMIRRNIITLRRTIRQQVPIIEQLERIDHPTLGEEQEEYFGDIADHIHNAREIIDEDAEIIASLAETADTLATHRINEIIRILTVISVIILPLTLLSSVYGMNIKLPFDTHPNAFIIVSVMMLATVVGMLAYFRKRNWL